MSPEAQRILDVIKDYMAEHGISPSVRDIAGSTGISPKSALHFLFELEAGGFIRRSPYRARTIQVVSTEDEPAAGVSLVPLVGMAAAGPMILAQQNIEEYIPVPTKLIGNSGDTFLLKVRGSSMQPYIENGDIAIVRHQATANKGDVIVACVEDGTGGYEATIKEYYPTDSDVILKPVNPRHEPILVSSERLHIQGVVKGVIKYFS